LKSLYSIWGQQATMTVRWKAGTLAYRISSCFRRARLGSEISETEGRLTLQMSESEARLKLDIAQSKHDILRSVGGEAAWFQPLD
jgi:hypothetical protein